MHKLITIIVLSSVILLSIVSCKQSKEDLGYENMLIGTWYTVEVVAGVNDTMQYEFREGNKGTSTYHGQSDEFGWEVKRKYINTVYKRSPSYFIGYDQYNSKGYYKLKSITDTHAEVVQLYYQGLEVNRTLVKK